MNKVDDRHKHIAAVANAKAKKRIKDSVSSDPNSVRYFLDLVNRVDSLQEAVAHDLAGNHRLREQFHAFMRRGHW